MIHKCCCLLALPVCSSEVNPEHCRTFLHTFDGNPRSYQRSCQLYSDFFQLLLGPQCHINAAIPPLHLSLSRPLPFLLFFFMFPLCYNSKNNAIVPPHQTPLRETIRGTDRERGRGKERKGITVRVEIWLCIKAELRGKTSSLNWLYIHEKKNRNVSVSYCGYVAVFLRLSHGANCLHATSVYFCTLLSKPFLGDRVLLSILFFAPFQKNKNKKTLL